MTNQQIEMEKVKTQQNTQSEEARHNLAGEQEQRKQNIRSSIANTIGAVGSFFGPVGKVASSVIAGIVRGKQDKQSADQRSAEADKDRAFKASENEKDREAKEKQIKSKGSQDRRTETHKAKVRNKNNNKPKGGK